LEMSLETPIMWYPEERDRKYFPFLFSDIFFPPRSLTLKHSRLSLRERVCSLKGNLSRSERRQTDVRPAYQRQEKPE
jgi:hypothetical protein